MAIILAISDHDAVVDVEGLPDKYIYEVLYMSRKFHVESDLEFSSEMSVGDRQRFVSKCLIPAFSLEAEMKLEERPEDDLSVLDTDSDGFYEADDDEEGIRIIDLLNQLMERIDAIDGKGTGYEE
jgi:hypothetical protein